MTRQLPVTEYTFITISPAEGEVADAHKGYTPAPHYERIGYDKRLGYHLFINTLRPHTIFYFIQRKHIPHWHLRIGTRCYEFVRSAVQGS